MSERNLKNLIDEYRMTRDLYYKIKDITDKAGIGEYIEYENKNEPENKNSKKSNSIIINPKKEKDVPESL